MSGGGTGCFSLDKIDFSVGGGREGVPCHMA
jgi:hypothetical protein